MKLLIVSHTPHHRDGDRLVGWGPTVREIDHLGGLFEQVVHVAPVHPGTAPASEIPYRAGNVRVVAVPPAGGESMGEKLEVARVLPRYALTIWKELGRCDVAHVRCPSNIGLVAAALLVLRRKPVLRWVKYAGNWRPKARESWSYRLQRWILDRGLTRSLVTVNGQWPNQPRHVRSFLNPGLTDAELREGAAAAARKSLSEPVRLLFVGRVDTEKGCGRAIEVMAGLKGRCVRAILEVIGDGPDRGRFEAQAAASGVADEVHFRGWLPRQAVAAFYAASHFLLLPSSSSEGWPKVLSEGMAYGVVPVTSDVSSIPQLIASFRAGRALDAKSVAAFVEAIVGYVQDPASWKAESGNAVEAAKSFTYDAYLFAVRNLLALEAA
ncbi:MAG TPA: glycosyltransferase [Thermoanaerobaculia bacterium]|jgi:glycosyltransferase involved in cell wall biosynthesis|nr:glycosyltransferase [Thermoanaerobaculia bacterium]